MRKLLALAVIVVASLAVPSAGVQPDPRFEQLAALVTQKMTEYGVPGVAFGIVKNGQRDRAADSASPTSTIRSRSRPTRSLRSRRSPRR